jgi:hypothetical protein
MGTIPFKDRKFRKMKVTSLTLSEAPAQLKDPFITGSEKPFHAKLRGGVEVPGAHRNSVYMQLRGRCWDKKRGFYFQIALAHKKIPDGLHHQGP